MQTAAEPDQAHQKNRSGKQLLRIRKESARVRRHLRRQTAESGREDIGQNDGGQQGTGNLPPWVARTGDEMFNQQRDNEEQRQHHAADPPCNRRPKEPDRRNRKELKEENACGSKNGAGKKKASAENQGDAILGPLKAHQSDSGKDEGEKAADDQQVALEKRIRLESDETQPEGSDDHKKKSADMRKQDHRWTATVHKRSFAPGTLFSVLPLFRAGCSFN